MRNVVDKKINNIKSTNLLNKVVFAVLIFAILMPGSFVNAQVINRQDKKAVLIDAAKYNILRSTAGLRKSASANFVFFGEISDPVVGGLADLLESSISFLNQKANEVAENKIIIPAAPRPEVSISENWFVSAVDSIKGKARGNISHKVRKVQN